MHLFIVQIPNKREPQQIVHNHSSDIDSKDLMNFDRKCTTKQHFFLVTDDIRVSDNPSRFKKNLLERI